MFSCANKKNDVALFKYSLETSTVETYLLNTENNDSLMLFRYQNLKDSIPNSRVSYAYSNQELRSRGRTFLSTGTQYEFENLVFTIYQETVDDVTTNYIDTDKILEYMKVESIKEQELIRWL